jgi:hypothetical protein
VPVNKNLAVTILLPFLLAANSSHAQSNRPVKGTLAFRIVQNITDPNKPPYISQQLFKDYTQQLLQKGPSFGRDRKDEFQWFEIMPDVPKTPAVAHFQGKQYVLLCTLPPFAMPADYSLYGGRIWGLTGVLPKKARPGSRIIILLLDENAEKILNSVSEANYSQQNNLAVLVDGTVISLFKLQGRTGKRIHITAPFTPNKIDQITSSLRTAMSPSYKRLFPLRPFKKGSLPPHELIDYWKKMLKSPILQTRLAAIKDMWRARHQTTAAMLLGAVSDPQVGGAAAGVAEMNQKLGIHTPAQPILELLKSNQPFQRAHAARLMTSHHDPNKFSQAAVRATSDSDGAVREWAFVYFQKNSPPDQVKQNLMRAVLEDPVWRTRGIAAQTLYTLAMPEAAPALIKAIEDLPPEVPEWFRGFPEAFHALITCGDPNTVEFLAEKAKHKDTKIKRYAINTIAWARWFPVDRRDAILLEAVHDPSVEVRAWTYDMIGLQKVTAANPALRKKILAGEDLEQEMLFFALSRIADRESAQVLLPFVEKSGRIAELALNGIANSANDSLINPLLKLTEKETGKEKKVRLAHAICKILEQNPNLVIDGPDQSQKLKKLIKEKSPNALSDKITLYQGGLAVADVDFFQRGERWLLKWVDGQWTVLVRFATWVV